MPKLVKASVSVVCESQPEMFLGCLASTQSLSLCSLTSSQTPYPSDATSFLSLEHLEICSCSSDWWNLLTFILNDAPRLRVLKLNLVCAFPPFFIVCPTVTKCHIVSEALCPARRDGFVEPTKFCS